MLLNGINNPSECRVLAAVYWYSVRWGSFCVKALLALIFIWHVHSVEYAAENLLKLARVFFAKMCGFLICNLWQLDHSSDATNVIFFRIEMCSREEKLNRLLQSLCLFLTKSSVKLLLLFSITGSELYQSFSGWWLAIRWDTLRDIWILLKFALADAAFIMSKVF